MADTVGGLSVGEYSRVPHTVQETSLQVERFSVVGDLVLPAFPGSHPLIVFVWGSGPAGRENIGRPSELITRFLDAGFAVFIEDKPGSGASTGEFSEDRLLHERAELLSAEIALLRCDPAIHPEGVGVYGESQAGYVMALALSAGTPVDFMIAVSCPATDSVEQSAYLVEQQLLCAGYPDEEARAAARSYIRRGRAQTYAEYIKAARFLDANPIVRDDLSWGGVIQEASFAPSSDDWEEFFDPSCIIAGLDMPVLALFGEKDTQVNPVQALAVYTRAKECSSHALFEARLIADADHNMRSSRTGCLKEQRERYGVPGSAEYVPQFLDVLSRWLKGLRDSLVR